MGRAQQQCAQLLGLLFGVVLGRLLDPADYGMIGMLAIFPAIASALQESGFVAALAIARKSAIKTITLYSGSVSLLVLFFIFCSILQLR